MRVEEIVEEDEMNRKGRKVHEKGQCASKGDRRKGEEMTLEERKEKTRRKDMQEVDVMTRDYTKGKERKL